MNLFACGATLLLVSSMSLAQLSFENPKNRTLPEDQCALAPANELPFSRGPTSSSGVFHPTIRNAPSSG
jgi:hypothetical protein